jgi:formylglycine-generating enzyme required for sulfatase activity
MSRALMALSIGALMGVFAQTGHIDLRAEPAPIIWLEPALSVRGAEPADLGFAVNLCLSDQPLAMLGSCDVARFQSEMPAQETWTDRFGIDRTEVTNAAYRRCVLLGRCTPSRIADDHPDLGDPRMPVAGISYAEAQAYCRFVSGRLPTEDEWERAARGSTRNRFPWGRNYDPGLANHGRSPLGPDASDGFAMAAPVGSFPHGASAYGLLDVAGNVWEWTSSAPRPDDLGLGADPERFRVVRGGSWTQPPVSLRVTSRVWVGLDDSRSDLGVRCAYDPHR